MDDDCRAAPGCPTRRQALHAAAAAVSVTGLAACGQDPAPAAAPVPTTTATPTPSATPTPTEDVVVPSGTYVVALSEVPVGQAVVVEPVGGRFLAVARPTADTAVAFDGTCPHKGCPVMLMDGLLMCHCHGSEFDMLTGARTAGPAKAPLRPVPVVVAGGNVFADL